MPETPDSPPSTKSAFDPLIQTEDIAFSPDELNACNACGRQNPPNRTKCMYCGDELEIATEDLTQIKPIIRPMESWERGFNVILTGTTAGADISIVKIASLISRDAADVESILTADAPIPLARLETSRDAEIMIGALAVLGLSCKIFSDEDLAADKLPTRLAGIEIGDGAFKFIDFNTRAGSEILSTELALIIPGNLRQSRINLVEKRRRKGAEVLDETESTADEVILDLYSRSDAKGFRIQLAGFDFSCLGAEKGFLAAENMSRLIKLLARLAPNVRVVDNYSSVKHLLAPVWEIEAWSDIQGIKRLSFGKSGLGKTETTSNLRQFTKFSRLQWHLL